MQSTHKATAMIATSLHRVTLLAAACAMLMVGFFVLSTPAQAAPFCPYDSTIASCTDCSTSGPGVSCTGGQLYRASDASCYDDPRPGVSNQRLDCYDGVLKCNTPSFPCSGCRVAISTDGEVCSNDVNCPANGGILGNEGLYANVCSNSSNSYGQNAYKCPSGTTHCTATSGVTYPNICVTNRTCPAGTTWNVCMDSCDTPNVLLSPGEDIGSPFIQTGYIKVTGDIETVSGDIIAANNVTASGYCIGIDCVIGWADLSPWLEAGNDIYNTNTGNVGIGTAVPTSKLQISQATDSVSSALRIVNAANSRAGYMWHDGSILRIDNSSTSSYPVVINGGGSGYVGINTLSPGYPLDIISPSGTAIVRLGDSNAGNLWTGVRLDRGTTERWYIGMNATDDDLRFRRNGSSDDLVIDSVTGNVGIQTATPAYPLDINGNLRVTGGIGGGGRAAVSNHGIWTQGVTMGGRFKDTDGTSEIYAAFREYAIYGAKGRVYSADPSSAISNFTTTSAYKRNKYCLNGAGDTVYCIGHELMGYGEIGDASGGTSVAVTFTILNDSDQGWVWRRINTPNTSGAMSLTSIGELTIDSDFFMQNAKAVQVNTPTGNSSLNIGNWGDGGDASSQSVTLNVLGTLSVRDTITTQNITAEGCFGPVFAGSTTGAFDGDVDDAAGGEDGYRFANSKCETQYGAGAHVCSSAEVMESIRCEAAAVLSGADEGVDTWMQDGPPGFTAPANDCAGWTDDAGSQLGRKWKWAAASGGEGRLTTCNQALKFACCK